jgi:hypothetical protein
MYQVTDPKMAECGGASSGRIPCRLLAQREIPWHSDASLAYQAKNDILLKSGEYMNRHLFTVIGLPLLVGACALAGAHQFGITEVNAHKQVLGNHDAPPNTEIHTAQPYGTNSVCSCRTGTHSSTIGLTNGGGGKLDPATAEVQAIKVTPDQKVVWALRSWEAPTPHDRARSGTMNPADIWALTKQCPPRGGSWEEPANQHIFGHEIALLHRPGFDLRDATR